MTAFPEPPLPPAGANGTPCHCCEAPLVADQRYCLECGARRGSGGPLDFSLLLGVPTHDLPAPAPATASAKALRALRAPLPVAAAMALALLVTGILLGSLPSSSATPRLAANASKPVDVVLPAPAGAATAPPVTGTPPLAPIVPVPAPSGSEPVTAAPGAPDTGSTDTGASSDSGSSSTGTGDTGSDTTTSTTGSTPSTATPAQPTASPIEHVFLIRLGEQPVAAPLTPDPVTAPYLAGTLIPAGAVLSGLGTIADSPLADSIALLSGQAPNPQTLAGCPTYSDVAPATIAKDGQEQGEGCVYSVQTGTVANELDANGQTWRAYLEGQASGGPGVATTCRRPAPGAPDPWREPRPGDAYITARNPFVYFHAVTDSPSCDKDVVDLSELDADLAKPAKDVPALSYIVPGACHDASATPCAAAAPAGLAAADAFLATVVPKIMASKAYAHGLIVVSFDRAFTSAAPAPASAAAGGATTGALLVSPFVRKGRTIAGRYDTYSLLAAIEDVFGLKRLGKAAAPGVRELAAGILRHRIYRAP